MLNPDLKYSGLTGNEDFVVRVCPPYLNFEILWINSNRVRLPVKILHLTMDHELMLNCSSASDHELIKYKMR
ncbi:hypothetical protein AHF37_03256 [Paragonimus kellicotti]|nr:hypothetical protein AHF37_03256 [Paragonimus kellicotti]